MKYKRECIIAITIIISLTLLKAFHILPVGLDSLFVMGLIAFFAFQLINYVECKNEEHYQKDEVNYANLDFARYICAIIIIITHVRPFFNVYDQLDLMFNNIVSRICVPLYFLITGYFAARKELTTPDFIKHYIKSMLPLYLVWSILYLPFGVRWLYAYIPDAFTILDKIPIYLQPFAYLVFIVSALAVGLCYIGTYYHLWYFPALILSLYVLQKWKEHFSIKTLLIIAFILLLFGATETYYGVFPARFQTLLNLYFKLFFTTRNFLFFGLFYVVFGYYIGKKESTYTSFSFLKCLFCVGLLITEVLLLYDTDRLDSNILLSCVPLVYYLFITLIHSGTLYARKTKHKFRDLYKYYYLLHPSMIVLVHFLVRYFRYMHIFRDHVIITLFIIILMTHLGTLFLLKLKERYPKLII